MTKKAGCMPRGSLRRPIFGQVRMNMKNLIGAAILLGGILVFAQGTMAQNCNPDADQIAVYQFPLYKGSCSVLVPGNYPNVHQEILKDLVRSIIVGPNVKALVCDAPDFGGACEEFERSGNVELKNPKYNPEGSGMSIKIFRRPNSPTINNPLRKKGVLIFDAKTKMVLGGYNGTRLVDAKIAADYFKIGSPYKFFGLGAAETQINGIAKFMVYSEQCESNSLTFLSGSGAIALSANLAWNPTPRTPYVSDPNGRTVTGVARDFLRSKGIVNPVIEIKQALRVDLDGDGQDETVMIARHIDTRETAAAQVIRKGSYSFLIVQKMIADKMANIVIGSDIYTKDTVMEQSSPKDFEVTAILDLDGDGTMEVIVYTREYESAYTRAFQITNGKAVGVLTAGCGA